ncbi:hypothetical protein [Qipengyuania flava]|uniref:hypothetical protein n=1 Tax=Qipengyuania flava TaxID=192812 RepID=UPI001C62754B|nr:hypothetical protein [Qipengyuania flava]QYJ07716.1 hypothetical protein KUV82_03065 [Qipengyuania flava]
MELLPLKYALETLTFWHLLIWLVLTAAMMFAAAKESVPKRIVTSANAALLLIVFYFWIAPIVGQLFGDKFSWAQVWPSGFVLGAVFSLAAAVHFFKRSIRASVVIVLIGIPFYGLGMSAAYWAVPRFAGFGLVELPKMPWGVSL